jgi:hypothetical protein
VRQYLDCLLRLDRPALQLKSNHMYALSSRLSSRTGNQHRVHDRLLDQPAGSRRVYWVEVAEGGGKRRAAKYRPTLPTTCDGAICPSL